MSKIIKTTYTVPDSNGTMPDIKKDIEAALTQEDQQAGLKFVETQAGLHFDMGGGAGISWLEFEVTETRERYERSKAEREKENRRLADMSPTVKASYSREEKTQTESPARFFIWAKDFIVALFCLFLGFLVVLMGAANVFAIIMASGTPVFLDEPRLAMIMAALLPVGSIALKFFLNYLPNDKLKKRYIIMIYILSSTALLAWIVLFALTFGSAGSAVILWEELGEQSAVEGNAFTIVQLLAELLVGTTLFLVAGDIFSTYAPTKQIPNPAIEEGNQRLKSSLPEHKKLGKTLEEKQKRLNALKAARQAHINTQGGSYTNQTARLHGSSAVLSK